MQALQTKTGVAAACLSCSSLLRGLLSQQQQEQHEKAAGYYHRSAAIEAPAQIYAFMKHLSQICHMPDAMQSFGEAVVNKTRIPLGGLQCVEKEKEEVSK